MRPHTFQVLLLFLALRVLLPLTHAISLAAVRIQTTFFLLPSAGICPETITHERLALYRRINAADPNGTYDGILWDDLEINGQPCISLHDSLHSTFFEAQPTPPPASPSDTQSPWFLIGTDNAPRRCRAYSTPLRASYLFTDDLPRFRARLVRDGLLLEGVATDAKRDTVFMFSVPFSNDGTLQGPPCAYVEEDEAQGVVSVVDAANANDEPDVELVPTPDGLRGDDRVHDDDGPACVAGDVQVVLRDGRMRRVDALRRGDVVRGVTKEDVVVSFSHADAHLDTTFLELWVRLYEDHERMSEGAAKVVKLKVTEDHLLLKRDGKPFAARRVTEGMQLRAVGGVSAVVNATKRVRGRGVWAPVMQGGVMVVQGGVVLSCYSEAVSERVAHALLAPVRAFRVRRWDWGVDAARWARRLFSALDGRRAPVSSRRGASALHTCELV